MDTPRATPRGEAQGPALRSPPSAVRERRRASRFQCSLLLISGRRAEPAKPATTVAPRASKVRNTRLGLGAHAERRAGRGRAPFRRAAVRRGIALLCARPAGDKLRLSTRGFATATIATYQDRHPRPGWTGDLRPVSCACVGGGAVAPAPWEPAPGSVRRWRRRRAGRPLAVVRDRRADASASSSGLPLLLSEPTRTSESERYYRPNQAVAWRECFARRASRAGTSRSPAARRASPASR
jgi:hypothetical protein